MRIEKLFQVLVVGGALLSGATMANTPLSCVEEPQGFSLSEGQVELEPIFCDQPEACVTDCQGKKKVKAGFECCWGTSCDNN